MSISIFILCTAIELFLFSLLSVYSYFKISVNYEILFHSIFCLTACIFIQLVFLKNIKFKIKIFLELKNRPKYWTPSWIYFIIDSNDDSVVYVGQTVDLKKREQSHFCTKYSHKNFYFLPIERFDINEIDKEEKYLVNKIGLKNLHNQTSGGSNLLSRKNFYRKPIPYDKTDEEIELADDYKSYYLLYH